MSDPTTSEATAGAIPEGPVEGPTERPVRALLAQHLPLSLLVDLAAPEGPDSSAICAAEGCPDDPWWSPEPPAAA